MNKQILSTQLRQNHDAFVQALHTIPAAQWNLQPNGKWSAGQQLDHIVRSVQPVSLALGLPFWVLRLLFGKSNRPSKSFEALVDKYKSRLAAGGKASGRFVPAMVGWEAKSKRLAALEKQLNHLIRRMDRFSETQLDTLLLPHPLLGKLTLREMLYFTLYHVEHHHNALKNNIL